MPRDRTCSCHDQLVRAGSLDKLPNLIANRGVVPEVLQDELTGQRLAAEALRLIEDPAAAGAQRAAFERVRAQLGAPGVGRRAAQAVIETARLGVPVPRA